MEKHTINTIKFQFIFNEETNYYEVSILNDLPSYAVLPGTSELYTAFNEIVPELNHLVNATDFDFNVLANVISKKFVILEQCNTRPYFEIALKME